MYMLNEVDRYLAAIVVGLNFFMMGITESSLYTILPKYLSSNSSNVINSTFNSTEIVSSEHCNLTKPPYVIVSMIFFAKNVAQLPFNPILGYLSDKMNNYFIVLFSQVVGMTVSIIYAFNNSVLLYVIGRILDGFLTSAIFITILSIISTIFTNVHTRGRYFGLANTFFFISLSLGPLYAAEIDNIFGKSVVFLSLLPLWVLCGVFTFFLYWKVKRNVKIPINSLEHSVAQLENCKESNVSGLDNYNKLNLTTKENRQTSTKKSENRNRKYKSMEVLKMLKDPFVLACLVQIFIVNLSMFSLPPTLPSWMAYKLCSNEVQQGLVWSFGFLGYLCGVSMVVLILMYIPKFRLLATMLAQILAGVLLIILPFSHDWILIFIPIIGMYFCVGIVEQVIFPLTTFLADSRFQSHYGTMSSLSSQSLTICGIICTLCSGYIADLFGFHTLSILLGVTNLIFSPIVLVHRRILLD